MALDKLVDSSQLDADLTSVANAIRTKGGTNGQLSFPQGFVDAIDAIPTGGGGKTNIDIGIADTPISNILNMFYALEHGTAKTGEFTLSRAIPNTEVEILDTELAACVGLCIMDESQDIVNTANTPENLLFGIVLGIGADNASSGQAWSKATIAMNPYTNSAGLTRQFLGSRCTWRFDAGKLYATGSYNRNDSYTPFHSGHTYRWVAW